MRATDFQNSDEMGKAVVADLEENGFSVLEVNLKELSEDFWREEAEEQERELSAEREEAEEPSEDFWSRIETFLNVATEKADANNYPGSSLERENIAEMSQLLKSANDWFGERQTKIQTEGITSVKPCPVAYNLELQAFESVAETVANLGMVAMENGDLVAALNAQSMVSMLLGIRDRMIANAPESLKELPAFSFSQVHNAVTKSLPEEYHCDVFTNTHDVSIRLETLAKRVARNLEIDTNEYPVDRYI